MENKRKNIYIVIFVITTIIASCVAVYFGIVGNKENEKLNQQISELNEKISEIEKSNSDLKESNAEKNDTNTVTATVEEKKVSDETAKNVIEGYINIETASVASTDCGILCLKYLGFYNSYQEIGGHTQRVDTSNFSGYKTEIKYEEFKNKMLNYMTENLFSSNKAFNRFKNIDGVLHISDGGASGKTYTVESVNLLSTENNSFKYEFTATYEWADKVNKTTGTATLVEENGKIVVDSCTIK